MKAYRIKDWNKHYENNRSRELRRPEWLPLPNTFDGRGFMELMDHPAGMSHYGAWCLLLGAASRMPTRGLLVPDSGRPLSIKDVSRMTRGSVKAFEEAVPRLIAIGWLEEIEHVSDDQPSASAASGADADGRKQGESSKEGAGIPQEGATSVRLKEKEKEKGERAVPAPPARSRVDIFKEAIRRLGLPAHPSAIEEWKDLIRGRAACATIEDACEFISWAVEQAKRDGVNAQYAKHVAAYADGWRAA